MPKLDRALYEILSEFALKETISSEGVRRLNIDRGQLEATDGRIAVSLKLSADAPFPDRCQMFPARYKPQKFGSEGYKKPKASKAKVIDVPAYEPGSDGFNLIGYRSVRELPRPDKAFTIDVPTTAFDSLSTFSTKSPQFKLKAATHESVILFLSEQVLTCFQRWQSCSRLVVPCLHNADPAGNQYIATLTAADLRLLARLVMLLSWGEDEFVQVTIAEPIGWNGGYNLGREPGALAPIRFQIGVGSQWKALFTRCEVLVSPLHLAQQSAEEFSTPQFPIRWGSAALNMHREPANVV